MLFRGATPETVKKAFEILLADPKVKSIFINIFGGVLIAQKMVLSQTITGIMRCDYIAEGVIKATKELALNVPLVVRLKGTKEAEAKRYASRINGTNKSNLSISVRMIKDSGLKIVAFDGLDDAAEHAVQLAGAT